MTFALSNGCGTKGRDQDESSTRPADDPSKTSPEQKPNGELAPSSRSTIVKDAGSLVLTRYFTQWKLNTVAVDDLQGRDLIVEFMGRFSATQELKVGWQQLNQRGCPGNDQAPMSYELYSMDPAGSRTLLKKLALDEAFSFSGEFVLDVAISNTSQCQGYTLVLGVTTNGDVQ